jgi:hypothetical protein
MRWALTLASCYLLLGCHDPASAAAPINLAPNSQWEVWSGVGHGTQQNPEGTGTDAPISSTGHSGGRTVSFTVATTGNLTVGDLVSVAGAGVNGSLTQMPMRVVALSAKAITVRVPLGRSPPPAPTSRSTILPVGVGSSWYLSNNSGDGPDGWTRSPANAATGPILWRDFGRGRYTLNRPTDVAPYALLGARLQRGGGDNFFHTDQTNNMARYAGMTVTFGIYAMQKVKAGANGYTLYMNDSVSGPRECATRATRVGEWAWSECTFTIPAKAEFFHAGVRMTGAAGDVYYFCNPILTLGSRIGGVQNYLKPPHELLIPKVHITPLGPWNGSIDAGNVTFPTTTAVKGNIGDWYGFYHDPYAETGGRVAPTVTMIWGQLEGLNRGDVRSATAQVRGMMWYDRSSAPARSGGYLPLYVSNVKSFTSIELPLNQTDRTLDVRGTGIFQSGVPGDDWTNVALEYDRFLLN